MIDYGDGECDDIATKEVDGIVENINLSEKEESKVSKYKNTSPLTLGGYFSQTS